MNHLLSPIITHLRLIKKKNQPFRWELPARSYLKKDLVVFTTIFIKVLKYFAYFIFSFVFLFTIFIVNVVPILPTLSYLIDSDLL
jgi:hypothetical protein